MFSTLATFPTEIDAFWPDRWASEAEAEITARTATASTERRNMEHLHGLV
jgi:hypothetical protein